MSNEDHRYGRFADKFIANFLADRRGTEVFVVDVSIFDRLVDDVVSHHFDERVLVVLIVVMEADEYFVSRSLVHGYLPSKSVRSSTSAIAASMWL